MAWQLLAHKIAHSLYSCGTFGSPKVFDVARSHFQQSTAWEQLSLPFVVTLNTRLTRAMRGCTSHLEIETQTSDEFILHIVRHYHSVRLYSVEYEIPFDMATPMMHTRIKQLTEIGIVWKPNIKTLLYSAELTAQRRLKSLLKRSLDTSDPMAIVSKAMLRDLACCHNCERPNSSFLRRSFESFLTNTYVIKHASRLRILLVWLMINDQSNFSTDYISQSKTRLFIFWNAVRP